MEMLGILATLAGLALLAALPLMVMLMLADALPHQHESTHRTVGEDR